MEKANSMGCNSKEQQKFRQKKQLKDKNKKQTHVQNNVTLLKVSAGENIRIPWKKADQPMTLNCMS